MSNLKINEEKWSIALIDYQNSGLSSSAKMNKLINIKNTGEIAKTDLQLLDEFYPFLDDEESKNLKKYIIEEFDYVEVVSKIRTLRTKANMTQKAFCELFGIPARTLQDWEYGKNKEPEYFVRLVEYYLKNEKIIEE